MFENEISELLRILETSSFYQWIKVTYGVTSEGEDEEEREMNESWFDDSWWPKDGAWDYSCTLQWGTGYNPGEVEKKTTEDLVAYLNDLPADARVFLMPQGTHCGALEFTFGWVHSCKNPEDIEEAVMPQHD